MPDTPAPERAMCEGRMLCRGDKPAVIEIMGEVAADPNGVNRRTIKLKLCVDCAGPLMRVGQPLDVSMSCSIEKR